MCEQCAELDEKPAGAVRRLEVLCRRSRRSDRDGFGLVPRRQGRRVRGCSAGKWNHGQRLRPLDPGGPHMGGRQLTALTRPGPRSAL
jgi:hypothetical protein